jgi:translation elongation factor EF-1beta
VTVGELSAKQNAVAEQCKACSSIHLAFEQLGFGVDAFGRSVVMGQGQGGVDGVSVPVEPAGEGV